MNLIYMNSSLYNKIIISTLLSFFKKLTYFFIVSIIGKNSYSKIFIYILFNKTNLSANPKIAIFFPFIFEILNEIKSNFYFF